MKRAAIIGLALCLVPACRKSKEAEGPVERAGKGIDDAADETGRALHKAAIKTDEAAHKAVQATGAAFEKAGKKLKGTPSATKPSADPPQGESR